MSYRRTIFLVLIWCSFTGSIFSEERDHYYLNGDVALSGYDPVSYFSGKGVRGSKKISTTYEGVKYYFESKVTRKLFKSDPKRYIPEYGGWCALGMMEGRKVNSNPRRFKIVDGRLLMFYDGVWGSSRDKWERFSQGDREPLMLKRADSNWQKLTKNL